MTDFADLLRIAHQAVDLASGIMRTMQPGALTAKGDRDMASEVDYAIEAQVRAFLAEHTPEIGFLGEENGTTGDTDQLMWALDPVDGTVNFIHGSPLCAVSLGLITEKRSVLGAIDLPFLGSRYSAAEGNGAHANGKPINVSTTDRMGDAVVAIGDYAVGVRQKREGTSNAFACTAQQPSTSLGSPPAKLTQSSCCQTSHGTPQRASSSPAKQAHSQSTTTAHPTASKHTQPSAPAPNYSLRSSISSATP